MDALIEMPRFAELLARSNGSFLEGASHPEEMVGAAKEAGLAALGIADDDGLYGIVKAHQAAKEAGIPLVVGARMTLESGVEREGAGRGRGISPGERERADRSPGDPEHASRSASVALLVRDAEGYAALCSLITRGRMRNPKGISSVTLEESSACAAGCWAVATTLPREDDAARRELGRLREVFGDRLSLAAARYLEADDGSRIERLARLGGELRVPLLATNEPLFHVPARRALHDVLRAIRHKTTVAELGRRRLPNAERHVKSAKSMAALFPGHSEALERSLELAAGCSFSLDSIRYHYPGEWLPAGFTPMSWLRRLCEEGLVERYPGGAPDDVRAQLAHELRTVESLDFAPYFLTVWDIVRFAREKKILCQGRGSAANSVVCYLLGITAIDPVRMNLLFERFISAERGEPPDIDVDFEHERREEVIQHIYEKYGRDRAGMVANVITYRHKMAVREVGKALGLSLAQVDRLSAATGDHDHFPDAPPVSPEAEGRRARHPFPEEQGETGGVSTEAEGRRARSPSSQEKGGGAEAKHGEGKPAPANSSPGLSSAGRRFLDQAGLDTADPTLRHVLARTRELIGFPRHLGIHSGGFSITQGKLCEIVPTENATMPGRTVVQWDKDDLAAVGILKIDVLALGMLTMIRKALDLMRVHEGVDLELATIPAEDPATYDMICEADTVGVFQIESRAQMNTLPRMLPRTFYDLVIEIALIRPGPITGGMVRPLLRRRNGQEPLTYAHPLLEEVLKRTYGVPVFQEQAIRLAVVVAGFTPGEADELRRAMTHKRSTERLEKLHSRLLSGMAERGIPRDKADEIVRQLSGFAGYGFPESHSASFALLVYASAWIKRHHHAAFTCALLNSLPMGFYAAHTLVEDAKRHGVDVRAVDATRSHWDCTLESDSLPASSWGNHLAIRVGYRFVRGLHESTRERLTDAIRQGGPFTSWDDMVTRARLPRDAMARIAAADGFRALGLSRREALWAALRMPPSGDEVFPDGGHGERAGRFAFPVLDAREDVLADYKALGLSTRAHPVSFLRPAFDRAGVLSAEKLAHVRNRARVRIGGMTIVRQRPPTATNAVFMTMEDETGFLNVIIPPEVYDRDRPLARDALFVIVEGTVERQGKAINVQAQHFLAADLEGPPPELSSLSARNFH